MTKVSVRKLSVLGLVLMGASAITAAVLPKAHAKVFAQGVIQDTSLDGNGPKTCKIQGALDPFNCDFTATGAGSATSGEAATSADAAGTTGATNTGLINVSQVLQSRA